MGQGSGKMKAVVFGLGQIFEEIKNEIFSRFDVVALTDNDVNKQGTSIAGLAVTAPSVSLSQSFDRVVVTTQVYQKQVVGQLLELGISAERIVLGVNYLRTAERNFAYEYYVDEGGQIRCRCSTEKASVVLIENPDFTWLVSSQDAVIIPILAAGRNYPGEELRAFLGLAAEVFGEKSGVFLDIGANIGTTALVATTYSAVSKVIAVEPSSKNFSLLQGNIFVNGLQNKIRAVHAAVSDQCGVLELGISSDSPCHHQIGGGSLPSSDTTKETVKSITLDSLLEGEDPSTVRFLWIDVQGYEYFVLKGAQSLLSTNKKIAVLIELWPIGLKATDSLDLLTNFCRENFSAFIDIREQLNGHGQIRPIEEISELAQKYSAGGHTDLFLIP